MSSVTLYFERNNNTRGYFACGIRINRHTDLAESARGKEWLDIIGEKLDIWKEDNKSLEQKLLQLVENSALVSANENYTQYDAEFRKAVEKQDEEIRKLYRKVLTAVCEDPSLVGQPYKDGETYDQKIKTTLSLHTRRLPWP